MTRILFLGDIFGRSGRQIVSELVPVLIEREGIDLVLANGENAAGGIGLSRDSALELLKHTAALSGGNHSFRHKDVELLYEKDSRLIRPANQPEPCPGRGWTMMESSGIRVAFGNLMGRIYLTPPIDCPFKAADRILGEMHDSGADITIIDFHAEATGEKMALAWYLDGRLGALVGTHTHVQTSDARIFPEGLAYITDVGMTGPHLSVIGMRREEVLESMISGRRKTFAPAREGNTLEGVIIDFEGGRATAIRAIRVEGSQGDQRPVK